MSPITTHVLDLSLGRPARGVAVSLSVQTSEGLWQELARGVTNHDGRLADLLPAGSPVAAGTYQLRFDVAAYYLTLGTHTFFHEVAVSFRVEALPTQYHVPLLISPFGYSTYRGS
jgi:5-hydroxyisourate hydrolase